MLRLLHSLLLLCAGLLLNAQVIEKSYNVNWRQPVAVTDTFLVTTYYPDFEGIHFDGPSDAPFWTENIPIVEIAGKTAVSIVDYETERLNVFELCAAGSFINHIASSLSIESGIVTWRKESYLSIKIVPYIKDNSGELLKITSFTLRFDNDEQKSTKASKMTFADNSALSSGDWIKFGATSEGVYKISYNDLKSSGINPDQINPRNIALFGYGGTMLPENNSVDRPDDMQQIAISLSGETDNVFNTNDYILFYHDGMIAWKYSAAQQIWEHTRNIYADTAWYYLTVLPSNGLRIQTTDNTAVDYNVEINQYDHVQLHEKEEVNLLKSGKMWLGEAFDLTTRQDLNFSLPQPAEGAQLLIKTSTVARSDKTSIFTFQYGSDVWTAIHDPVPFGYANVYANNSVTKKQLASFDAEVRLSISYSKPESTSTGWLDYIALNSDAKLELTAGQKTIRFPASGSSGIVNRKYIVNTGSTSLFVWNVTDLKNIRSIKTVQSGASNSFIDEFRGEPLKYVVFDGRTFLEPVSGGKVGNQNLHSLRNLDMIVISPPVFFDEAQRLADFHILHEGFKVKVLTPGEIYNEFSSGMPDPVAIRSFMKMLYDKSSPDKLPRYLLLFGDGSYDHKYRIRDNNNFIPTYQTSNSLDPVRSAVYDDFFGLLDDTEGTSFNDPVDIGIGRMPVQSAEEAADMVDKIISYSSSVQEVRGDWRNVVTFIADDEDDNSHIYDSEMLAMMFDAMDPDINVDKIYLDSYIQEAQTSGDRYPSVNKAINQRVDKGSLFVNYIGHGGETGLAHEKVLQVSDINSWTNRTKLPLFVTATCEFSRFDDPERESGGEYVFLNPFGGSIALLTTTRPTFGQPNFSLNKSILIHTFFSNDASSNRLGDIIMKAKQQAGSDENGRKFVLLGDPALKLALPENIVKTVSVNNFPADSPADTLAALSKVVVEGEVTDGNGVLMNDFNGFVIPTVFDKPSQHTTLANDGGSKMTFEMQKNIIYRGTEHVKNGKFSFTFIVPADIAFQYGKGKISYYAYSNDADASGSLNNIFIGGISDNPIIDDTGPEIRLFINDTMFTDGSISGENPILIAHVFDENGINTIGTGIGHDITAVLDNESTEPYILNEFFTADINTYKSGKISFPFHKLNSGTHSVKFKVWDLLNNSSEREINFIVYNSSSLVVENLRNYPNPFSEHTSVLFDQNQRGTELDIILKIYNLSGMLIRTIETTVYQEGTSSFPVIWDGKSANGHDVPAGLYVYSISVASHKGGFAQKTSKMIYNGKP